MAGQAHTSRHMRGSTQEQMIRRRDASGDEMQKLARIMSEPKPDPEEVSGYIRELLRKEHITEHEASALLATIPHDSEALRRWARAAFSMVMHQGIHAHAAYPKQLYPSPQQAPPPEQEAPPAQAAPPAPTAPGTPTIQ